MGDSIFILLPIIFFLVILLGFGLISHSHLGRRGEATTEYFLAGRGLRGIVLAMTLVATYGSVSSFVSGPGVAWQMGFGWVVFAAPQIITGFLILGVVGKRLALLSRSTSSLTIIDIINARYQSKPLAGTLGLLLLVFFTAMIVGQFIGGAQIFAAITGYDYKAGLLLFAVVTVVYTTGGFRTVAVTDLICAVLMLVGMFALGAVIINDGGGIGAIVERLAATDPGKGTGALMTPNAGGALPYPLLLSAWLLVGFGTIGLPQSLVRCMSYRSTSDLHTAMVVATVVCGALMIGMTMLGVLSRAVVPELPANGTDAVIPTLVVAHMHPILAGITIIGPLAATMSTVSSLLLSASATIVRDLALTFSTGPTTTLANSLRWSVVTTSLLGAAAILLAMFPQDIVVWVNMFAFGGLETAFLWPIVLGLFWPRMNAQGALLCIFLGIGCYLATMILGIKLGTCHNIVVGLSMGLLGSVAGSLLGDRPTETVRRVFFPHRC